MILSFTIMLCVHTCIGETEKEGLQVGVSKQTGKNKTDTKKVLNKEDVD